MNTSYNSDNEKDSDASDDSEAPELGVTSRADFEALMDDFLNNYELLGRKMKPKLEGQTGLDKLSSLREALRQDEHGKMVEENDCCSDEDDVISDEDAKGRLDCETV